MPHYTIIEVCDQWNKEPEKVKRLLELYPELNEVLATHAYREEIGLSIIKETLGTRHWTPREQYDHAWADYSVAFDEIVSHFLQCIFNNMETQKDPYYLIGIAGEELKKWLAENLLPESEK